ncbi:MAG: DUF4369 domain-containing protein, partial [Arcobacter sp.]|nr:DUF4369 domain-containing protein [Arcobacter sp.]
MACNKKNNSEKVTKHRETNHLLDNEYLIKGQVFNENFKSIYLYKVSKDSLIPIDTSLVVKNVFKFKGEIGNPAYFTVKTNANNASYKFLADASKIDLFLHDKLGYSTSYSNSGIQKKYKEYTSKMFDF